MAHKEASELRPIEITQAMIKAGQNALTDSYYLSDPTVGEEDTVRKIISAALSARHSHGEMSE